MMIFKLMVKIWAAYFSLFMKYLTFFKNRFCNRKHLLTSQYVIKDPFAKKNLCSFCALENELKIIIDQMVQLSKCD